MVVIKVADINVYYDSYEALSNVTLSVNPGEIISVIGPNGSGKTTLLKTINGIIKPLKGSVYIDGRNIYEYTRREIAKIIGYVPQRENVLGYVTVLDFVLTGRRPNVRYTYGKTDVEKAYEALRVVNCENLVLRRLDQLSGGELQRVLVARAIVSEPQVLLLDEPTSSLDPKYQVEILELVKKLLRSRGISVIMSLHDLTHAYRYSDKVIALKKGKVVTMGPPKEVITEETILKVFEVKARVIRELEAVIIENTI
ncbi:MAG: ABC transporter ATP-binding protein [Desulfurococcaceae archaeon]